MEVIPAVDIRGGKCVRLYQGDYRQETVFFEDPVAAASNWKSQGARRLHIVDLDGAAQPVRKYTSRVHSDARGRATRKLDAGQHAARQAKLRGISQRKNREDVTCR